MDELSRTLGTELIVAAVCMGNTTLTLTLARLRSATGSGGGGMSGMPARSR